MCLATVVASLGIHVNTVWLGHLTGERKEKKEKKESKKESKQERKDKANNISNGWWAVFSTCMFSCNAEKK